jgi:hypothetical protein
MPTTKVPWPSIWLKDDESSLSVHDLPVHDLPFHWTLKSVADFADEPIVSADFHAQGNPCPSFTIPKFAAPFWRVCR